MMARFLPPILLAALVAACAVGPDYQPPQPQLPDHWSEQSASQAETQDLALWWRSFNDPELDRLVNQAIAGNLDLKRAVQRIEAAKAERVIQAAGGLPTVTAGASASNARSSETLSWPPGNGEYKTYQYGLESSWEIDVFGKTKRAVEAADATIGVAIEDRRAIMVALLGEVAADYVTLRSAQHRLDIAQRNIATEQRALALSEKAFSAGLGTDMDVARARATVETSQGQVPQLTVSIGRMSHAIAVLLGRFPGEMTAELETPPLEGPMVGGALPVLPAALPSDVVRNRPDIRRAERRIAVATAQVGVATADLFPHFVIPLGLTPMTSNLVNLFDPGSLVWSFGLSASQTLYDGGRSEARVKVAQVLTEEDRLAYQQTILAAFREVEDRLIGFSMERQRHDSLAAAAADERRAFDRASQLYANGLTDFLKVLDSERALFRAEDSVAESELVQRLEIIGLYRAFGGGWQSFEAHS